MKTNIHIFIHQEDGLSFRSSEALTNTNINPSTCIWTREREKEGIGKRAGKKKPMENFWDTRWQQTNQVKTIVLGNAGTLRTL